MRLFVCVLRLCPFLVFVVLLLSAVLPVVSCALFVVWCPPLLSFMYARAFVGVLFGLLAGQHCLCGVCRCWVVLCTLVVGGVVLMLFVVVGRLVACCCVCCQCPLWLTIGVVAFGSCVGGVAAVVVVVVVILAVVGVGCRCRRHCCWCCCCRCCCVVVVGVC